MSRGKRVASVALGLLLGGCSTLPAADDTGALAPGARTEFIVAAPPSSTEAAGGESAPALPSVNVPPGAARLVLVPEWKLYLREGRDVVEYKDRYYLWANGQWYVAKTDRGPWRPVTAARSQQVVTSPAPAGAGDRVAHLATRHVGAPYEWGGADPTGFDCSGLVMYVYAKLGVALPHNAARQYAYGLSVDRDDLRPGDLVFFDRLRHNGIYIGRGQFVHASQEGRGVRISRLDEPWFRQRWVGGRRLHIATSGR